MSHQSNKVNEYIRRLEELTQSGKIAWNRISPTVYSLETTEAKLIRVTIQEAKSRSLTPGQGIRTTKSYLFQVHDLGDVNADMIIDSKERPEYQDALVSLFSAASLSSDSRSIDVLEDLIKRLSS